MMRRDRTSALATLLRVTLETTINFFSGHRFKKLRGSSRSALSYCDCGIHTPVVGSMIIVSQTGALCDSQKILSLLLTPAAMQNYRVQRRPYTRP